MNKILIILILLFSSNVYAQRTPERDLCIQSHFTARGYIAQKIGKLVDLKNKGEIDYDFFIFWQNQILQHTEYPIFKITQLSYSGESDTCVEFLHSAVSKTDVIMTEAMKELNASYVKRK